MLTTHDREEFLISTVIKLLKRRAIPNLRKIVDKTHPADIAHLLPHLSPEDKSALFPLLIETKRMAEVMPELNSEERNGFIQTTEPEILVGILHSMPADDVSNIVASLPAEKQQDLIKLIEGKASADLEQLLQHEEKTAGYIMTPDFFALPDNTTVAVAIEQIQNFAHVEMVFYVYVVDDDSHLKGVISLRQLVATRPNTLLKELMTTQFYAVHTNTPQEEVAQVVSRYNLLAVPVLDDANHLVGIVTIDDVIDVIREETTEDMLKMAGTGDVDIASSSVFKNARARMPWLFTSWCSGIVAAQAIGLFQGLLEKLAVLAVFIPVINGMGGNVGLQSATIIVRGLATGEVNLKAIWRIVWREFAIGAILGVTYGLLLGLFTEFRYRTMVTTIPHLMWLPVVVALSITLNMVLAATVGTVVPMLFKRLQIGSAIVTGPFVTASLDVCGTLFYFTLAKMILF